MFKFITYWPKLIKEIYQTAQYYKAVKSIESEIKKEDLKVDWIGRIYTIVAIKEELIKQPEMVQQSYVFQQLKPIGDLLLKHGLSNQAYPEIIKKSANSFLVILYPENRHLTLIELFKNTIYTAIFVFICYLFYLHALPHIVELIQYLLHA